MIGVCEQANTQQHTQGHLVRAHACIAASLQSSDMTLREEDQWCILPSKNMSSFSASLAGELLCVKQASKQVLPVHGCMCLMGPALQHLLMVCALGVVCFQLVDQSVALALDASQSCRLLMLCHL